MFVVRVNHNSVTPIAKVKSEMERRFLIRVIDRIVANARVIRAAPEAVALIGIITLGFSYFGFQHFHHERLTALNDRIASQERLVAEYQTKLRGATPDEAVAQIEKLMSLLAETQKSLSEAKSKPVSLEKQSRDPRRLYDESNPIAEVQEPKLDLESRKIIFPAVNSAAILEINKSYEFRDWRLACGSGTQLYNMVRNGVGYKYSYSPLTCKVVGSR